MDLVLNLLSLLIIFLVIFLCLMLFFRKNGDKALKYFRYFLIATALWLVSNYALRVFGNYSILLFSLRTTFATAALMIYTLCRFSQHFPNETEFKHKAYGISAVLATALIIALSYTNFLVSGFTMKNSFVLAIYGSSFNLFLIYVLVMFGVIIFFLINQYHISSQLKKQQAKFLFIGVVLSMIFISSIDLIIPLLLKNNTSSNFGPYGIIFMVAFAILALTKHHLFETKVIISEFWATFLVVAIFAWLVTHFSVGNLIGFAFILSICVLFIRSVISESTKESELLEANQKLEKDKKELVELDQMKDEFLQMATHELNTPITAIQGKLDMAVREDMCKLDEKQKSFFKPVLDQTMRLARLSKDVLDVARIDQHRLTVNTSETDINTLISQIVAGFDVKAKEKNNTLTYVPSGVLPKLMVDQSKISEVLTNLITNANKFTENGKITVAAKLTGDNVLFSVTDTGIGIDKKDQEHLFEKFYQAGRFNPDNPQEQQGSGLGLYISQSIINLHGGKMWLESNKGKGSTFYFSLPLEYKEVRQTNKLHSDALNLKVL